MIPSLFKSLDLITPKMVSLISKSESILKFNNTACCDLLRCIDERQLTVYWDTSSSPAHDLQPQRLDQHKICLFSWIIPNGSGTNPIKYHNIIIHSYTNLIHHQTPNTNTMEFVFETNELPSIVGSHRGQDVASPLEFPKPTIWFCTTKHTTITDPSGSSAQAEVLVLEDGSAFKIDDRILKETIYGSVHCAYKLAIDDDTGGYCYDQAALVACKKYSKSKIKQKYYLTQEDPLKEFAAMQFLGDDHPHIMGQIKCIEDDNFYYSIMRFCTGGELFEYLDAGSMQESKARKAFLQIVAAMEHMHAKGVAHRDMSLENLLIFHPDDEERMQIIVIDWGMCVRVPLHKTEDGVKGYLVPAMGCCGKKNYIAPEVIRNADKRTATPFSPLLGDVWSLGVILFMLLTSIPPFEMASDSNRAYSAIRQGKLGALLLHWGYVVSAPAQNLLNRLFTISPMDRPTFDEIKNHPWMTASLSSSS